MKRIILAMAVVLNSSTAFESFGQGSSKENHTLSVKVSELRNAEGSVFVCLWRAEDKGFPRCDKGSPFKKLNAKSHNPVVMFSDVPSGNYAVSVFHDEKDTGKMETNFLGFPKSGIGVSGTFSKPPTFSSAQIQIPVVGNSIDVKTVYLSGRK